MAADPTLKLQHIWHALMNVLGSRHRVQYNTNRAYIAAIERKMRRR